MKIELALPFFVGFFFPSSGCLGAGCRASRHSPVGETEGSLLAISSQESLGRAKEQYAIAARHCASIEGSAKAGPHTCSCRTMVVCAWREKGGRRQVGRTNHVCLHNLYEICNALFLFPDLWILFRVGSLGAFSLRGYLWKWVYSISYRGSLVVGTDIRESRSSVAIGLRKKPGLRFEVDCSKTVTWLT
jgi:hypothetical protein